MLDLNFLNSFSPPPQNFHFLVITPFSENKTDAELAPLGNFIRRCKCIETFMYSDAPTFIRKQCFTAKPERWGKGETHPRVAGAPAEVRFGHSRGMWEA